MAATLAELTNLSVSLVRQASGMAQTAEVQGGLISGATGGVVDPLAGEEDTQERNPKYSTANSLEYYLVRDNLIASVWGGEVQGQSTVISNFINTWVEKKMETGDYSSFPTADQLLTDPDFMNGAWATRFRAAGAPSSFIYTDDEGNQFWVRSTNAVTGQPSITPISAPQPQTTEVVNQRASQIEAGLSPDAARMVEPPQPEAPMSGGSGIASDINFGEASPLDPTQLERTTTGGGLMAGTGAPGETGVQRVSQPLTPDERTRLAQQAAGSDVRLYNQAAEVAKTLPNLNTSQLGQLLNKGRGGGGGGGGGGRAPLAFDTAAMEEAARQQWRRWLFEDPGEGKLSEMIRKYQNEANAFWVNKGGRLDFEVFVRDQLREQPRYASVMKWKPPEMGEDEFLDQYRQIEGFGLRSDVSNQQILRSIQSGGSAASQTLRVSRTREASNLAGAGTRLANTINQLGAIG